MTNNERLKKSILWIISQGLAISQEDIASMIGLNAQYLSQLVSGKNPINERFAKKFVSKFENINIDYILGDSEVMLINNQDKSNSNLYKNSNSIDFSELFDAVNNIAKVSANNSETEKIRAETEKIRAEEDKIRAEAELKRAEAEDRNSRNMEELIKLLQIGKQKEDKEVTVKKEILTENS